MTGIPLARTSQPTVSVVIPVYNSVATLECCVRSAMAQTLADIEILIADDASTDGSGAVAASLMAEDSRIRLIQLPSNRGKSHAMNCMVDQARGDWIAVLDADDSIDCTRLARLMEAAEVYQADLVADNLHYFDAGVGQILRMGFEPFVTPRLFTTQDIIEKNSSFADFDYGLLKPMVRRTFVQRHGLRYYEKTRLAEDFYYLLGILVAGGRGCLVGQPLYRWTLPFGTASRSWTTTGAGAWRYNYRDALAANAHFINEMNRMERPDVVAMLHRRARQYAVMIHYLGAQRLASERRWLASVAMIMRHPSTYPLLLRRVLGRIGRLWASPGASASTAPSPASSTVAP